MESSARIVCVVGGTSGIGRACVEKFLAVGCSVVAIGRGQEHVDQMTHEFSDTEGRLVIRRGDCSSWKECQELASFIDELFGRLDVLVNAAGILRVGGVPQVHIDDWNLVMNTNISGAFYMTRACIPLLEHSESGPAVVNISSSCTARPCPSASYTVSKAALEMLTVVSARDLAPLGIRVNAVAPGLTDTNMQIEAGVFANQQEKIAFLDSKSSDYPLGRTGEPSDTADAVFFLASEMSPWTTGTILRVDGGISVTGASTYKAFEGRSPAAK